MLANIELELAPKDAFEQFVAQLKDSLKTRKIEFNLGEKVEIHQGLVKIGQVVVWQPPKKIEIDWYTAATWNPNDTSKLKFEFEGLPNGGTRITIENEGWGSLVEDRGNRLSEWFADEIAANLIDATSPRRFVNWLTDRRARRPMGAMAREGYRDPVYHRPNFLALFDYLKLKKEDYLLEVGCGGGAFLFEALKSGCRAAAIDHSPDMVMVAKELNSSAIAEKRLEILESEAESLPFPDGKFTCAVCTGVFGFIDRPVVVLSEVCRVMVKGGRLIVFVSTKELKGTPAAPEPIASQLHFYEDQQLVQLAHQGGFEEARVERISFEEYARQAKIPQEAMGLFSSDARNAQLLLAQKI
ncbi:MAG: methyltransferase domain-containing protein [archaeon]|nr:methyltransferase domain-containing protein [archaeon]